MTFKNLSIARKIRYMLIGVSAVLIALLVLYWVQSLWQGQQQDEQARIIDQHTQTQELYIAFLELRQQQKEYLNAGSADIPDSYKKRSQQLVQRLRQLSTPEVTEDSASDRVTEASEVAAAQLAEFETARSIFESLGQNNFEGVRGKALQAILEAQSQVDSASKRLSGVSTQLQRSVLNPLMYSDSEQYAERSREAFETFQKALNDLEADVAEAVVSSLQGPIELLQQKSTQLQQSQRQLEATSQQLSDWLSRLRAELKEQLNQERAHLALRSRQVSYAYGILMLATAAIIAVLIGGLGREIVQGLRRLTQVMRQVNQGDLKARTNMRSDDELGEVGTTFDRLLDERIAALEMVETQNNALNESIIRLIQTVGQIANDKDFTSKVPVAEDVTGAVADSINLLVSEVSEVLHEVVSVSRYLSQASQVIAGDAQKGASEASEARQQLEVAVRDLEASVTLMGDVSEQSSLAADWADNTIQQTQSAFEAVTKSVDSVNGIRHTIAETEKRIKRLGERSQEITGIVNLINNIAERTHILALNASMHAASAGEAGRGFAVVADEVQRLAENAREATSEISTLVNNIHVETADTVSIMNTVIEQVAEGTRLADQAGGLMTETKVNTAELVTAIKQIAEEATEQAQRAEGLKGQMQNIEEISRTIDQRLDEQRRNSGSMAGYADDLVRAVEIFQLPDND
ncbi:methyl-accepting chemotaxis protein [gamma proteobacterium HTCC5015]|nr:methyl-accepting chemotaxis protein [gamma proteobacterium HTCC5015]